MAKDVVGKQTEVDTLAGDSLSVDGEGQMVLLVPTGLTVTRVGDQVIVERDVAAVTAPEVEVAPASPTASPSGQQTEVTEQGDMPATEHQQQVLRGDQQAEQEQMGATGPTQPQSGQQAGTRTQVTEQTDMPATEHQQQVLRDQPATEQQQTAPQDTGMPSSPHQEQVLRGQQPAEEQQAGQQQSGQQQMAGQSTGKLEKGVLRETTVIEPDIRADNGVIHAIDAVLVPQSVLSKLESMPGQRQQSQGQSQQSKPKQG